MLAAIGDELHDEYRLALYVVQTDVDVDALESVGLIGACVTKPAKLEALARDVTRERGPVVLVAAEDPAELARMVADGAPSAAVRILALPPGSRSVAGVLGYLPGARTRFTDDEAEAARETWLAWAGSAHDAAPPAGDDEAPASPDARKPAERPFHQLLDEAVAVVAAEPDVASHGGRLVQIVADDAGRMLRAVPLAPGSIRERLTRAGVDSPPLAVVNALAEVRGRWAGIAPLPDETPTRDWRDVATDPPLRWLAGGTVPRGGIAVMVSMPNAGKSMLAVDLALRLAHGVRSWLGTTLAEGGASTLYLSGEGQAGLPGRFRAWKAAHPSEKPAAGRYVELRGAIPSIATPEGADKLLDLVAEVAARRGSPPDLLTIDTWATALAGADENDTGAASAAVAALRSICARFDCTTLVLHHVRKSGAAGRESAPVTMDSLRGSGALAGSAESILALVDGQIRQLKSRDGGRVAPLPYVLAPVATGVGDEQGVVVLPGQAVAVVSAVDAVAAREVELRVEHERRVEKVLAILEELGGQVASREVVYARMVGKNHHKRAAFAAAVGAGRIVEAGRANQRTYRLALAESVCVPPTPPSSRGEGREAPHPAASGGEGEGGREGARGEREGSRTVPDGVGADGLPEQQRKRRRRRAPIQTAQPAPVAKAGAA